MGKKVAGVLLTVGTFILAGIWGTYASIKPEFFRANPNTLLSFGLLGLILVVFSSVYLGLTYLSEQKIRITQSEPLNSIAEPIQDMQVELIEHGAFSSELLLECVNHGGPVTLTANLRIVGASSGLTYKNDGYQGAWEKQVSLAHNNVGVEFDSKPTAYLPIGSSAKLRIATIEAPQKPEGNAYMRLFRRDEWATWDLEHEATSALPYFIVKIEIRAKDKHNILRRTYKVGPPHRSESLRMVECAA